MHGDIAVKNFSMKRKATMTNRRLTIFASTLVLMTGCSADTTVNPEILDLVGTWNVLSEVYTRTSDGFIQDNLDDPLEASESYIVFYDDNDVLFVTNYVDTLDATTGDDLGVESFFDAFAWCVQLADDDHRDHFHARDDCLSADDPADLIIDEGGSDELFLTFSRNGDNMTISSNLTSAPPVVAGDPRIPIMYDFGAGDEAAMLVITMERIILDIERPPLTCPGSCPLGT